MCDYSLMSIPNRLAVRGEELIVHRFYMGSLGLASAADVHCAQQPSACIPNLPFFARLKRWFYAPVPAHCPAVCIPPGARLLVRDIPVNIQQIMGLEGAVQEVTFTQIGVAGYRDAIRFKNGAELLLQKLTVGQSVRVLALSSEFQDQEPGIDLERFVLSGVGL